jgi:hypothetical protein
MMPEFGSAVKSVRSDSGRHCYILTSSTSIAASEKHMPSASRLYAAHIKSLGQRYDRALEASGFDAVLIGAGQAVPVYRDDQHYPYRAEPLFLQWAPLLAHPGSALFYRPGKKPLLLVLEPVDYWHQPAPMPAGPWQSALEIRTFQKPAGWKSNTRILPWNPFLVSKEISGRICPGALGSRHSKNSQIIIYLPSLSG